MRESILVYRDHLYLKLSLALTLIAIAAYVWHQPFQVPNGGTWLGYTLGTIAAGLMLWLAWFGIRKRRYGVGKLRLEDWLSAHVYLGLSLAVIATLHAGFQVGWNVHTVLYVLMLVVVVSGIFGVYFYTRYPLMLTQNRRGLTAELMLTQVADLDREIRQLAMGLDDATNAIVLKASQDQAMGNSLWAQLRGYDENSLTAQARVFVESSEGRGEDTRRRQLLARIVRKEEFLKRICRDVQLRCLLKIWLVIHVPFSVAALAALFIHVLTVFYYW